MLAMLDDVQDRLESLADALGGQDASAIIAATEALAAAVILCRGGNFPAGSEQRARFLMDQTLSQLEAAAIRVNILKDWTRQRIDKNHAIRGFHHNGMALTY